MPPQCYNTEMDSIATSTLVISTATSTVPLTTNGVLNFIQEVGFVLQSLPDVPAAAYVLLGVIISGLFSILSDNRNIKNSKETKKLEIDNSTYLKELEVKNARELFELQNNHSAKMQDSKVIADKSLRLLDDRLKVFTDFHHNFSDILGIGTDQARMDKIGVLRKDVYKLKLLTTNMNGDLRAIDSELTKFANFYLGQIHKTVPTLSPEEKDIQINAFTSVLNPLFSKISAELARQL